MRIALLPLSQEPHNAHPNGHDGMGAERLLRAFVFTFSTKQLSQW